MMTPGAATTMLGDLAGGVRHQMGPDLTGQDALIAVPAGLFNTLLNQTGAWIGNQSAWGGHHPHHFGGHHAHHPHQQAIGFGSPWQQTNPWAAQYANALAGQYGSPYAGQYGSPFGPQHFGNPMVGQYGNPYAGQYGGHYGIGQSQFGSPYAGQYGGGYVTPFQVLSNGMPR